MITGLFLFYTLSCVLYIMLFMLYAYGWYRTAGPAISGAGIPVTTVDIVIAARNEEHNIAACINSLLAQDYHPELFRIIVADDHSTDRTATIVRGYDPSRVQLIRMQDMPDYGAVSFKKMALAAGINAGKGALIITTDADCIAPPQWLSTMVGCFEQTNAVLIAAPVRFVPLPSLAGLFQSLDFMAMQGITAATVRLNLGIMCNGANLAFTREAYTAVNGYEGISHIVSGDDYLLMMKIRKKFPGAIRYLRQKTAIIDTLPQPDWRSFFRQRIRWASKTGKYDDPGMTWILLLVYLFNLSALVSAMLLIFYPAFSGIFITLIVAKILMEWAFLLPVSLFYNRSVQLLFFPFLQPLHILYIVVAGFLSTVGKYSWKDRTVQQR